MIALLSGCKYNMIKIDMQQKNNKNLIFRQGEWLGRDFYSE